MQRTTPLQFRFRLAVGALLFGLAHLLVLGAGLFFAIPPSRRAVRGEQMATLVITDRRGEVLREVRSTEYGVTRWVGLSQVSPRFTEAILAAEDRRFFRHHGVDIIALGRALLTNARAGRVVSGGSTITQQLVRCVSRPGRRGMAAKLGEMLSALRLELHLSKQEILEAYVNRVWFGNQLYGIDAASRTYFDRSPDRLSLAQACYLAAVVRSPADYDLYRRTERCRARQRWILDALLAQGRIDRFEYETALTESVVPVPPRPRFRAPHFVDMVLVEHKRGQGARRRAEPIRTTLDWHLQQRCEDLVETQLCRLSSHHVTNAAVVVLERVSGDVLAMVGSRDYYSADAGQVNACLSLRQPGSAVKPFVYALAFEQGMAPATIVPDLPGHFSELAGDFVPRNYDREFHGPVSCRTALGSSYNVPAVRLTEQVGVDRLLSVLRRCGIVSLQQTPGYYGLALGLGVGDVTLLELVNAYRVLANSGVYSPVRKTLPAEGVRHKAQAVSHKSQVAGHGLQVAGPETRLFSPQAAYLVTDILSDNQARASAFGQFSCLCLPFPCAVKTGTSKDYRDNWTIGYTQDYVVGVWVGNFDGSAMHRVSGVTGAGPIFRDVMLAVQSRVPTEFNVPKGIVQCVVCPKSGRIPGVHCAAAAQERFIAGREPRETCSVHRLEGDRVVEAYPPEYWAWMAENGMPLPQTAAQDRAEAASIRPTVLFPDEDDVFKIDPDLSRDCQAVLFKGIVPVGATQARWILNGRELAAVGPPFTLFWNLVPGRHRLRLEAAGRSSEEVSFLVLP